MKNGGKKKLKFSPVKVPRLLQSARDSLICAYHEDNALEKFAIKLEEGKELTIEGVHAWLIAAIDHYEKNGAKAYGLKMLRQALCDQSFPDRQ